MDPYVVFDVRACHPLTRAVLPRAGYNLTQMEQLPKFAAVAIGGAFGAVARYLINISPLATRFGDFPFATFVINIAGSFLIGVSMAIFAGREDVGETTKLFVGVGFLGAFTTFSTFQGEMLNLFREGRYLIALAYLVLSVVIGFAGVALGFELGRKL
jgi:CrcB protein